MSIQSIYVAHMQISKLCPFPLYVNKNLRPIFQSFFKDKKYFTNLKHSEKIKSNPLFIRHIGGFSNFSSTNLDVKPNTLIFNDLGDDRLYNYYLTINKGIHLRGFQDNQIKAEGKIYLHIFSSGYVVTLFEIHLKSIEETENDLYSLIKETHPEQENNTWDWESKFGLRRRGERRGRRKLSEIAKEIKIHITESVFKKKGIIEYSQWHSLVLLESDNDTGGLEENFQNFFTGEYQKYKYRLLPNPSANEYFLISDDKIICKSISSRRPRSDVNSFFRIIQRMYEYIVLKNSIYDDLIYFFGKETVLLNNDTNSIKPTPLRRLFRLSVQKPQLRTYHFQLRQDITKTHYYKKIYSEISKYIGLTEEDGKEVELNRIMNEWEEEVDRWVPFLIRYLRYIGNIISTPIRLLRWIFKGEKN